MEHARKIIDLVFVHRLRLQHSTEKSFESTLFKTSHSSNSKSPTQSGMSRTLHHQSTTLTINFLIKTLNNVGLDCLQQMFPTKFDNFFMMNNRGVQTKIFAKFMFEIFIAFATQKPSTDVLKYSFVTSITPIPHLLKPLLMSLKMSFYVKPRHSRSTSHFLLFYNIERLVNFGIITPVTTISC